MNLWPIMQEGEDVVRGVHGIHRVFCKEVTVALRSLLKVSLLSRLDIVEVDGDKAVSVRSCMLVDKAKSMDQLVNWSHEPTGAVLCNWCSYIFIKSKRINRTIFQQIVANIDISSSYF